MKFHHAIWFCILSLITFCVPAMSHSDPQVVPWVGGFAGNKIPLREVLSSSYMMQISSGPQSEISTRLNTDQQKYVYSCKANGGHAIVNMALSVSVGEVLLGVGSATKHGFVLTFTGDCVTESKPATK